MDKDNKVVYNKCEAETGKTIKRKVIDYERFDKRIEQSYSYKLLKEEKIGDKVRYTFQMWHGISTSPEGKAGGTNIEMINDILRGKKVLGGETYNKLLKERLDVITNDLRSGVIRGYGGTYWSLDKEIADGFTEAGFLSSKVVVECNKTFDLSKPKTFDDETFDIDECKIISPDCELGSIGEAEIICDNVKKYTVCWLASELAKKVKKN